jgi:hypothetical protein
MDNNTRDTFAALSSDAKERFLLDAIQSIPDQDHQVVINPLITHLRSHYIDGKFDEQGNRLISILKQQLQTNFGLTVSLQRRTRRSKLNFLVF